VARQPGANEYRVARQASGLLLVVLVFVIVSLDVFRTDFDVNPLVLVPILLTAGALFSVDVPGLRSRVAIDVPRDYGEQLTADLRALARDRGLSDRGTRDELIRRLAAADVVDDASAAAKTEADA
jgi:hypothetical protein